MIRHLDMGTSDAEIRRKLTSLIKRGEVKFGGYAPGKIYGTLSCGSGRRMKMKNRVFFSSEEEAIKCGFRPCGNCMPDAHKRWKSKSSEE